MSSGPCPYKPAPAAPPRRAAAAAALPVADSGLLPDLLRVLGADAGAGCAPPDGGCITLRRVRQGSTLLHEGGPVQALYVLRSGSVKCVRTLEDGYEQVLSFAQAGEIFGFEALHCGHQPTGVVALEDSTVHVLALPGLRALRQQCAALDQALVMALSRQLVHAAASAEMMSAVAAEARLARFLLNLSMRMAEAGQSSRRLRLRMCRREIASLLGVAHETVSRSFSLLADAGFIRVENRDVEILDADGLRNRGRCTRGSAEASADAARPAGAWRAKASASAWFPRPHAPAGS